MEVDNVRLRVLVGFVFDERLNGLHAGEGFHSEFTVESASESLVGLILFLCSMPDYIFSRCHLYQLSTSLNLPFH